MKKQFIQGTVVVLMGVFASGVWAKPPTSTVRSETVIFDDMLINGETRQPAVTYSNARERVKFERLLSLKKSFMRAMFETQKERALK